MGLMDGTTTGKQKNKTFMAIYGGGGLGKTTFAASAPKPYFLDFEHSSDNLNVTRAPIGDWDKLTEKLNDLIIDNHEFKTVVIDSADKLELVIHRQVCLDEKKKSIEDIGYSKGYIYALTYWDKIFKKLNEIRMVKEMNVILIAHQTVKRFNDPYLNEGYDRHEIKLHHKAADLMKESLDMVLFCRKDVALKKGKNTATQAFNSDDRYLHTQLEAAFDAKNRIGLPPKILMPEEGAFDLLQKYIDSAAGETAEHLYAQCIEAIKRVEDEEMRKQMSEYVEENKEFTNTLRSTLDRILSKTREE